MRDDNNFGRINIFIFCAVLAVLGLVSILMEKPTFSEIEKRELAKPPKFSTQSLFSGEYTSELSAYYADTFPARELFITLGDTVEHIRGIRPDEVRVYEAAPTPKPQTPPVIEDKQPKPQEETPGPDAPTKPPVDESIQNHSQNLGNIMIYQNRGINLFGSTDAMAASYASVINTYAADLPGVQIYNMVVPVSSEFYMPQQYAGASGDQKANIDYIYSQLDPSIKSIDAYGAIAPHVDEYVYFRTDHHWTALGAYYAYEQFCEVAGFEPTPMQEMEKRTIQGFLGTFYGQTGDVVLGQNPDYVDYYIPPVQYTAWMYQKNAPFSPFIMEGIWGEYASSVNAYSVFLHGDWPMVHIETENQNGRKLVIIKESYGNAFAPFMLPHFEDIFVVDQRYYQTALVGLVEEQGVTDILILNNIFAANTPYHIQCINNLKYQVFTPPPPSDESHEEGDGDEDEDKE